MLEDVPPRTMRGRGSSEKQEASDLSSVTWAQHIMTDPTGSLAANVCLEQRLPNLLVSPFDSEDPKEPSSHLG